MFHPVIGVVREPGGALSSIVPARGAAQRDSVQHYELSRKLGEALTQTVTLEPGATQVVGWPVEVAAAGETAARVVAVDAEDSVDAAAGQGDAVELPLVVRELAVPVYDYATGRVEGSGDIAVTLPDDALPGSAVMLEIVVGGARRGAETSTRAIV